MGLSPMSLPTSKWTLRPTSCLGALCRRFVLFYVGKILADLCVKFGEFWSMLRVIKWGSNLHTNFYPNFKGSKVKTKANFFVMKVYTTSY